jgi:hypothetical protein
MEQVCSTRRRLDKQIKVVSRARRHGQDAKLLTRDVAGRIAVTKIARLEIAMTWETVLRSNPNCARSLVDTAAYNTRENGVGR